MVSFFIGLLTGLAPVWVKDKMDNKNRTTVNLRHLLIELKEYKKEQESIIIGLTINGTKTDRDPITQEAFKNSRKFFRLMEKYCIFCPREIQTDVNEFKKINNKAREKIRIYTLQLNGYKNRPFDDKIDHNIPRQEIDRVSKAYNLLVKKIEGYL